MFSLTTSARDASERDALIPAIGVGCITALALRRPLGLLIGLAAGGAAYWLLTHRWDRATDDRRHEEERIDEALEETFPASDPPSVGR